jgi:hypothetical protein
MKRCDRRDRERWQKCTKTWIIGGDIGFRRHRAKKPAVSEAKDYCRYLSSQGYVTKLTICNKNGNMFHQIYPGLAA